MITIRLPLFCCTLLSISILKRRSLPLRKRPLIYWLRERERERESFLFCELLPKIPFMMSDNDGDDCMAYTTNVCVPSAVSFFTLRFMQLDGSKSAHFDLWDKTYTTRGARQRPMGHVQLFKLYFIKDADFRNNVTLSALRFPSLSLSLALSLSLSLGISGAPEFRGHLLRALLKGSGLAFPERSWPKTAV